MRMALGMRSQRGPAHAYDQGDADERAWYGGRCNRVDKGYGEKAVVINLMQPEPDDGIE